MEINEVEKLTGREKALLRKRYALHRKYSEALALYAETELTMKDIVRKTGVPAEGFRFYLHKWHKTLVWEHLGIIGQPSGQTDLRKEGRRMKTVAAKYAEAIKSLKENPRPSARVAAEFGFHPEVFRSYLHKHESELAGQIGMTHNCEGKLVSVRGEKNTARPCACMKRQRKA